MVTGSFLHMHRTDLPDGCHGKVEFHKDGSKWQQTSSCKEHIGMAGPMWRRDVSRNLVGSCWVCDNGLLCSNHSP